MKTAKIRLFRKGDDLVKKKIIIGLLAIIIATSGLINVDAISNGDTYNGKLYEVWDTESGVNVYGAESNGWMDYNSWMIKSTADNNVYYCIDPALPLEGSSSGSHTVYSNETDIINHTDLTSAKLKKVKLLAYYGYGYHDSLYDHRDKKWYGITQVMIWRIMRPDLTWTFKKTRNGTASNSYFATEVAEMNKLVSDFDKNISFNFETKRLLTGTTIEVEDTNKVLYQYKQNGRNTKVDVRQEGNKLYIHSDAEPWTHLISFSFNSYTNDYFTAFVSSDFQDIIKVGQPTKDYQQFYVEVYGGKVTIQKLDEDKEKAVPQGEATLEGAIYEVFNSSGNSVGTITTDTTGKGTLNLDYGTYTMKEKVAPKGYKLSNKEYTFTISKTNYDVNVNVTDKVIKGKLKLEKTKGGSGEEFTKEEGATFDILDKDGNKVEELITNEKGMAIEKLPYGKYTIHQTSGAEGYIFADDIELEMYEDKIYELDVENLKPSKLEFTKEDYSTGKPIPDVLVEIYKDDDTLIGSCRTNEKGKCELPDLEIGNYYILEKEAPKYYRLNEEKMPFEVTENGKVIKATMKDERKEGNLIFTKTDITGKKKLEGALIEIYFNELKEKVYKGKTDKNGEIKLEGLVAGKYCIYEKEAPEGYELDSKPVCFEFEEEGQVINITMRNNEKIIVPDTNLNDYTYLVSLLIVLAGVGYLIYDRKKH